MLPLQGMTFDASNKLYVNASLGSNVVSAGNSTIVPLGIAGVFNGAYVQVLEYNQISVIIFADEDGTLKISESSDGINPDKETSYNIEADLSGQTVLTPLSSEYIKITYTNGAVAQTIFRLETLLQTNVADARGYQLDYPITKEVLAQFGRSALFGKYSGDNLYYDVEVTDDRELLVKPTASGKLQFWYDGALQDVIEDTGVPANNRPLPVKITSVTGDINITAGDLNVQLSHAGANYDSTRIGDGTTLLGISLSGEAKTQPNGNVAHNAPDSGNPIKVGAIYRAAAPTLDDGDRSDLHVDSAGNLMTTFQVAVADNAVDAGNPMKVGSRYNLADQTYADGDRADLQSNVKGHLKVYDQTFFENSTSFDLDSGAGTEKNLGFSLRKVANGGSVPFGTTADPFITNDETLTAKFTAFDLDTGVGTENNIGVSLRLAAGGGSVPFGTDTNPIITQPKGGVASNDADSGNPIKVGGVYVAAGITLDNGDRGDLQLDASGNVKTTFSGGIAHNAADAGNPLKVGGIYRASLTTLDDGDRSDLHTNVNGRLLVSDEIFSAKFTAFDLDTGGGTENNIGISLRRAAAGGSVEAGTSAYPIFVSADAAVANNAADSGNPIKVGGKYNTDSITLDDADRGDLQMNVRGAVKVVDSGKGIGNAPVSNNHASVSITTGAYVQLVASTTDEVNELEIFDSSGEILIFALGAAAAEVDKFYIVPGGNDKIKFHIPKNTRVAVKALTANTSDGYLVINFFK